MLENWLFLLQIEQLLLASVPSHYHFKAEIGTSDTGWLKTIFIFSSSNYLPHQNCQNRNFLSVGDGGRLGNLMSQYATLWAASKLVPTKVIPVITTTMHTALTKIFPNISIPKMPECKGSYNWTYIDIKVRHSELQLGWIQEWWWIWNFCPKCHLLQNDVAIKEFCQV